MTHRMAEQKKTEQKAQNIVATVSQTENLMEVMYL